MTAFVAYGRSTPTTSNTSTSLSTLRTLSAMVARLCGEFRNNSIRETRAKDDHGLHLRRGRRVGWHYVYPRRCQGQHRGIAMTPAKHA